MWHMFKVNYKDTRMTPVSIVNFDHILYFVLVLALNMLLTAG